MKKVLFLILWLCLAHSALAQKLTGTWSGVLDAKVTQLHIVFHLDQDSKGKTVCTMDCPDQSLRGIPTRILHHSADSVKLEVSMGGMKYEGKLEGETLKGHFSQMGINLPLELKQEMPKVQPNGLALNGEQTTLTGAWSGLLDAGLVKLHVVIHLDKDAAGQTVCTMDSPDQGAKGMEARVVHLSADSLSIELPRYRIVYHGKLEGDMIKGQFTQAGQTFPLNLQHGEKPQIRPQHPVPPYPYTTEEVTFQNPKAKATLAGTLTYPVGYQKGQQVPVVLMVTGSGPQDRNEELFGHKPFLVIADFLARHGIASLRYDDRKVGQSTGSHQTSTTLEVADDAQQGVRYLRGLKKFSRVGVIGHSEGANVVFMLGAKKLIDFGVSMAGVGVLGRDALYAQAKTIVEKGGHSFPYDLQNYLGMVGDLQNPWLNFFIAYYPPQDIQKTTCPIFALNGNNDMQVIATQNLVSIKQYLPKNPKNKVKLYPGLNHLFQHCQTGLPTEYASIEETISTEVLNDMTNWIKGL